MKKVFKFLFAASVLLCYSSCADYLDVFPEDKITGVNFWENEGDVRLALIGIYSVLKDPAIYGYGGGLDATTPNAFQWAWWEGKHQQIGNGTIQPGSGFLVDGRWKMCYRIINRVNYFLENIELVDLDTDVKNNYIGEATFLRGVAYSILVDTYGGVPILTTTLASADTEDLERASISETWAQVHSDYDVAITTLQISALETGRATIGAALGMKMRAYLYQGNWDKVLEMVTEIDLLGLYFLYPSYQGLFQVENENNQEVIFDVQFIAGENGQGSPFDQNFQPQNILNGISGANSVAPIQDLVDAYETIDGSPVDPADPYANRDPRLDFTILRPGALFQGQLFPTIIKSHPGQKVAFGIRKYMIENMQVVKFQSPLNFIVLRYADVLLAQAEAMIENGNISGAIDILNRIRTERTDVSIPALSFGLSQTEARDALRKERRIEFALEGLYWSDIKRWNAGPDIYPVEVRGADGSLIETKFGQGYDLSKDNLLPIPDAEISLNPNLIQNPGY
jgi:hypothetical protein